MYLSITHEFAQTLEMRVKMEKMSFHKNLLPNESINGSSSSSLTDHMASHDHLLHRRRPNSALTINTSSSTDDDDDDDNNVNNSHKSSSKLTQEWLDQAKLMVASSPPPSRLATGSPRFALPAPSNSSLLVDRRDPLSRSARRHRAAEGFSGEILSKTAKHTRNRSETFTDPPAAGDGSPTSAVQKWISNILDPPSPTPSSPSSDQLPRPPLPESLSARQSMRRKSRFQTTNSGVSSPQGIPSTPRRSFKTTTTPTENQLLSPPKNLTQPTHHRSNSGTNLSSDGILSPPRNLVESVHRRLITSATCSSTPTKPEQNEPADVGDGNSEEVNRFLKEQRMKIEKILSGEMNGRAKIVLSGPSNSTSSMVAAICYSWLLENRRKKKSDIEKGREEWVVAPVMNASRRKMWTHRQAAWLFNHVGLDASALLFSDEVDLERLMMGKQLSILIVGEDILKTDRDVSSRCTILTDNYCEDSYDLLLQSPILKNLLLAGVLLDTQNLDGSGKLSMTRDAEAVQLLSVASAPNYRNTLYEQLVQDHKDGSLTEVLQHYYGKPPNGGLSPAEQKKIQENAQKDSNSMKNTSKNNHISSKSANAKPVPIQAAATKPETSPSSGNRGKNKFFLAKWFGFGSK